MVIISMRIRRTDHVFHKGGMRNAYATGRDTWNEEAKRRQEQKGVMILRIRDWSWWLEKCY